MRIFQKGETQAQRRQVFVQMVDSGDHITPKTGLAPSVQIVRAGESAYADIVGAVLEIGHGTYRIDLDAPADLGAEGEAMLRVTADGAVTQFVPIRVVTFPDEVHLAKAALVNARTHTIETGVDVIRDDDGVTTLRTLTPAENNGVVTVTPG